jgi:hypothetical protein
MKVDHAQQTGPIKLVHWDADHVIDLTSGVISASGNQTLDLTSNGMIIKSGDAVGVTYTLPGTLPVGYNVMVLQRGVGAVTFAPSGSAALHNLYGYTKTGGQYAVVMLFVDSNVDGASAEFILAGNGA